MTSRRRRKKIEGVEHRAQLADLIDAWWASAEAMGLPPATSSAAPASLSLVEWHAEVFQKILKQCGWTVDEWNVAVETAKATENGT